MTSRARVSHIIRNDEITITECDLLLAGVPAVDDLGEHALTSGGRDFAQWDNATPPGDAILCPECFRRYNA